MSRTTVRRTLLRRAALAGAALLTAATLAACGDSDDHDAMPGMQRSTGSSANPSTGADPAESGAATFDDQDVAFAQMMIPHHQQAVQMATLAGTRAADGEVKELAAKIKGAQDPEITQMTGWLRGWGHQTMPASGHEAHEMPGMMSDTDMTKLKGASGKEFDRQFCTMMIAHHQGAVDMAKTEITDGSNPAAKELAMQIIAAQQAEIAQLNTILKRL